MIEISKENELYYLVKLLAGTSKLYLSVPKREVSTLVAHLIDKEDVYRAELIQLVEKIKSFGREQEKSKPGG